MLATKIGRNRYYVNSDQPLTENQLAIIPSLAAKTASPSRSKSYSFVSTMSIIQHCQHLGFEPFMACQSNPRTQDRVGYTRHMVRLRQQQSSTDNELANEIILVNSHDGTSSYQMFAGWFRFVCQNGLVAGTSIADHRLRHMQDLQEVVYNAVLSISNSFGLISEFKEGMLETLLTKKQQLEFIETALYLRYGKKHRPVQASQLNVERRPEDAGDTLWHLLNRVQEHLIVGGVDGISVTKRYTKTRPVSGIETNLVLNRNLWDLAQSYLTI